MIIGTLKSDDGDGNEDVKKAIGLITKKNNISRASHFFVHFFAVTAGLRRETDVKILISCSFKLYRGRFLNSMDLVLRNSMLGGFTYI